MWVDLAIRIDRSMHSAELRVAAASSSDPVIDLAIDRTRVLIAEFTLLPECLGYAQFKKRTLHAVDRETVCTALSLNFTHRTERCKR